MTEDLTGTPEEIALREMWRAEIVAGGGRIPRGGEDESESEDDFEDDDEAVSPLRNGQAQPVQPVNAERAATFAAARTMAGPGASTSTVNRAAAIIRYRCPALIEAVQSGALAVKLASEIARLPAADQPAAIARHAARRTALAKRKAAREAKWEAQRAEREARAARDRQRQERRDEKAGREYAARKCSTRATLKQAAAPGNGSAPQDALPQDAADEPSEIDLLSERLTHRERVARGEA